MCGLVYIQASPLYYALWIVCFLQIEDLWQPCIEQVYCCHFSSTVCSLPVCVTFWDYRNVSNFSIILFLYGGL